MMRSFFNRSNVLPAVILLVCCLICWHAFLTPKSMFSGMDFFNLLLPQFIYCNRNFCNGTFTLWCFEEFMGTPLFAAMQSSQAYPISWIMHGIALSIQNYIPFLFQIAIFLHLFFAAVGATLFCSQVLQIQFRHAVFSGVVYACSGFILGHIEQFNSIAAISFIPWQFAGTYLILDRKTDPNKTVLWLTIILWFSCVCGHPQYFVLSGLFIALFSIIQISISPTDKRCFIKPVSLLIFAYLLAFGLSGMQLIPTHELSQFSERIRPYADPDEPSLKWSFLQALIYPQYFNKLAGNVRIPIGYTELGLYSGILTFPLLIVGMFSLPRNARVPLISIFILSLLYALGKDGGVSWIAQKLVSYLNHSRGSARTVPIFILFYSTIATHGLFRLAFFLKNRNIVSISTTAIIASLTTALDLTCVNKFELSGRLIDRRSFETDLAGNPSKDIPFSRIYRFTANDSDYFLDYTATALRSREKRLQPNLNLIQNVHELDGYEEGLLPTRKYANFLRYFNRNLRDKTLDSNLLAILGVSSILTEYPYADFEESQWDLREKVNHAGLTKIPFKYPHATVFDYMSLLKDQSLDLSIPWDNGSVFCNMETSRKMHPFSKATSSSLIASSEGLKMDCYPNLVEISTSQSSDHLPKFLLISQPPFPGWKCQQAQLTSFGPVMFLAELSQKTNQITIRYLPYSFRIGCFITLTSFLIWLVMFGNAIFGKILKNLLRQR